jgi:hypothetical protein
MTSQLPQGFSDLECFVGDWVLADSRARSEKRQHSPYADIKVFYDAMLAQAPAALAYLSERQLGALDAAEECLLKLLLSLAEIGPAVEWYENPAVIDGLAAHRFPLTEQLSDTAAQE